MKSQIHNCIIYADKGKVSAATFQNDAYVYVKDDGNNKIQISENFWNWWKEKMEYVEGDVVDICVISDRIYPELELTGFPNIVSEDQTFWTEENIRSFLKEMIEYTKILLKSKNGLEMNVLKEKIMCGGAVNNKKVFYTNMNFKRKNSGSKNSTLRDREAEAEDATNWIQYWRDLKKSDLNNSQVDK